MNWLSPLTALYAGSITVPLLLLLYFLKLKRRENIVPSTLLWRRAVQDLQVNAPFQKLRRNILLLLQILMLLAMLVAMAGPVLSLISQKTERYVILIDNSASMNATDVKPNRLEYAKDQAKIFVSSLTEKSSFTLKRRQAKIMIVSINDNAKVVCNFSSDTKQLINSIDQIKAGDGGSNLGQALTLARAYCQSPDPEANNRSTENAAKLVLFSDGRIRDVQNLKIQANEMIYQSIGNSFDNVAITAMKARRSFENAERVDVFVTVNNYNDKAIETNLELNINGDIKAVKTLTIPPRSVDPLTKKDKYGQVSVDFDISSMGFGVIEVRQMRKDHLAVDDTARAVILEPQDIDVLLVSDENPVLESVLNACSQIKLYNCTRQEFTAMDPRELEITKPYEIIVLDNHDGGDVARGSYLVFGIAPEGAGVKITGESENQFIADYRGKHPVLNYVNMDNLFVGKSHTMELPRDGQVLAEFDQSPAIAIVSRNNSTFILAGFDVMQSNWPFEPGFVLFVYNSVSYLADNAGLADKTESKVGEPVILQGIRPGTEAVFNGPGYENKKITVTNSGNLRLPIMERVGQYVLELSESESKVFVVNLLDNRESDIRPEDSLTLTGQKIQSSGSAVKRFNMPLWPYFIAAVLMLVCIEWIVYNSKIRI